MYPAHVFDLFPPHPREPVVFVAMSFAPRFSRRWTDVIEPAIREVVHQGQPLRSHRVDTSTRGDSIPTEIVRGVADSLLIFADVTTIGELDSRPVRNQNVMYEVGLAHAVRQPEEVLIFRSDREQLPFDIAGIRVNDYDPDMEPQDARATLQHAIKNALGEIDARRSIAVDKALRALGAAGGELLIDASDGIQHPEIRTIGQAVAAMHKVSVIDRMAMAGMISTKCPDISTVSPDTRLNGEFAMKFRYELTPFGHAVRRRLLEEMGVSAPHQPT